MMLEFLETGKALYLLMAVCVLGLLSRLTARNLYKRLIRETDNMTLTKNRCLRDLRQKAENTYRLNLGIHNTKAYLEKQLSGYRFWGFTLNGWGNLTSQLTVLCFLLGGSAAFGAYWYRCDSYYVVLYGTVGLLSGLLTLFLDCGINLAERKNQLLNNLQDYLENSLFHRLARETGSASDGDYRSGAREGRAGSNVRSLNVRDLHIHDLRSQEPTAKKGDKQEKVRAGEDAVETAAGKESSIKKGGRLVRKARTGAASFEGAQEQETSDRDMRNRGGVSRESQEGDDKERGSQSEAPRRDVDYLKHSLEQIAASREKGRGENDWIRDLSPEELELVGEILKQYLA